MTGQAAWAIFRAPGGKTSPALLQAAAAAAGPMWAGLPRAFWVMNCPATRFPNAALLEKALRHIRAGDVLVAHLGIWSRQDAWAPAVLEPLIRA
jgi:peptidoglycan-N-acetylmuramic acid deacetylase